MAGFRLIEIHAAHGYLLNEFMTPLANQRSNEYGGSFENPIWMTLETVRAIRSAIPNEMMPAGLSNLPARLAALLSLLLWAGILTAGRAIGYVLVPPGLHFL